MNSGTAVIWSVLFGSMTASLFIISGRLLTIASLLREIHQELQWARQTGARP